MMIDKKQNIFKKTLWFNKNTCEAAFFADLEPKREVQENPRFRSGEFYSAKCKRNIHFESDLEYKFFQKLEKMRSVYYYWEQPKKAPYWRGKVKSYTIPDAGVIFADLKVVIVEVKPLSRMLDYKVQMKVEGLIKFCAENGCGFLFTDGVNTLDKIRRIKCNHQLEKEILEALEGTVKMYKKQCKEIMERCHATQNELLKIIYKHNLQYKPFPFTLRRENKNVLFHQIFYHKRKYDELREEKWSAHYLKQTKKQPTY